MALQTCEFRVYGQPIGKGRPRFTRTGHTYTPQKTRDYEDMIARVAWSTMKKDRLEVTDRRISLIYTAFFDVPKSYTKQKTSECQAGIIIPNKPDIDNIGKAICDACNKIVYQDDCQIWHLTGFKRYCDEGQRAHIHVKIQWDDPSLNTTNLVHIVPATS